MATPITGPTNISSIPVNIAPSTSSSTVAPTRARASSSSAINAAGGGANDASARLAEAIDDFLGDIERKFKHISDEVMSKLDDMAERCDRLEQEMMAKEAGNGGIDSRSKSDVSSGDGRA